MVLSNLHVLEALRSIWTEKLKGCGILHIQGSDVDTYLHRLVFQVATFANNDKEFSNAIEQSLYQSLSKQQITSLYLVDKREQLINIYRIVLQNNNQLVLDPNQRGRVNSLQLILSPNYPRTLEEERDFWNVLKLVNDIYVMTKDLATVNNSNLAAFAGIYGATPLPGFNNFGGMMQNPGLNHIMNNNGGMFNPMMNNGQRMPYQPQPVVPVPTNLNPFGSTTANAVLPPLPPMPSLPMPLQLGARSESVASNQSKSSSKKNKSSLSAMPVYKTEEDMSTSLPEDYTLVTEGMRAATPEKMISSSRNRKSDISNTTNAVAATTEGNGAKPGKEAVDDDSGSVPQPRPRGRPRTNNSPSGGKAAKSSSSSTSTWKRPPPRFAILKDILQHAKEYKETTQNNLKLLHIEGIDNEIKPSIMNLITKRRNRVIEKLKDIAAMSRRRRH